jgi:diamine N-acetyltransferase
VHLLAVIAAKTQRLGLAEKHFQQAIALTPNRADFYGNYANLLWESGRLAETIHVCQRAIALQSDSPEVFNTLGNALFRSGEFHAASEHYRTAINLRPTYAEAHNNLGQALKALHDYAGAEQCFRSALALQADFAQARENLEQVDTVWLKPLQGKRLTLRRCTVQDADFIQQCYQNPDFMHHYNQFMPPIGTEALRVKLLEEAALHPTQLRTLNWIITLNGSQRSMGLANLVDIQLQHRRAEFSIGIPDATDRTFGHGTEAALLVMNFAFNQIKLNKLLSFIYSDNAASIKNTQALGFSRESVLKQHLRDPDTNTYMNLYGNAITTQEFHDNSRLAKLSQRLLRLNN